MTITLIITGAMYGFITSGSNAFTKEPSLADRQQQLRIAMDRIQNDILVGGMNLGPTFQTFAPGLNGASTILGVTAAQQADILEVRTQMNDCPQVRVCPNDGANHAASQDCKNNSTPYSGGNLNFVEPVPACYPEPGFALILYGDGNSKFAWGHNVHGGGGSEKFNFPGGQQPPGSQVDDGQADLQCSVPASPGGGPFGSCPVANQCGTGGNNVPCPYAIVVAEMIRYEIGVDPTDGAPALYRSSNGGFSGAVGDDPVAASPPGAGWQLIARGIEDMQVRYRTRDAGASGADFWSDNAPLIVGGDRNLVVREVEVTLWARALGLANVTGMSTAANNVTAVRGSMTLRVTPRAALDALVGAPANRWQ